MYNLMVVVYSGLTLSRHALTITYTMQILMSVLVVMIIALIMLTVLTLMVATTVHAILDMLEMASTAQV